MYPRPSVVSTSARVALELRTMPVSLAAPSDEATTPSLTSSVSNGSRRPLISYFGMSGPVTSGMAGAAGGLSAVAGSGGAGAGAGTRGVGTGGGAGAGEPPQAASAPVRPAGRRGR